MNCPFCWADARSEWGYQCGSGPSRQQRSIECREREIRRLRVRVADIDDEAHDWREYAKALERIGDEMKHTCDATKWDARRARRPQP